MTSETESKRRLAAIMFTDIAGYTALMGKDESHARSIIEQQNSILYPIVSKHGGKVIKEIGDGTLSRFASALQAVHCAIELQQAFKNVQDLNVRVGIHVGDILIKDGDVFGDGVNIAARLEPLAPVGGISISERVHAELYSHPEITAVSLGVRKLKNVKHPMKVLALTGKELPAISFKKRFLERPRLKRGMRYLAGVFVLLLAVLVYFHGRMPVLADVPSIGVLYLKNLGSPDDEYLAYGITEDMIIDLAKAGSIRVPPLNDVLPFKESESPLAEIASKLDVRYILTGSLRRSETNFRLAAQLVEPSTGKILWSNRWEQPSEKVASIKGKMIQEVLNALGVVPQGQMAAEIQGESTSNPEAYEFYLKGKYRYDRRQNLEDLEISRDLLLKAVQIDSTFIQPRIVLARSYAQVGDYDKAMEIHQEALRMAEQKGSVGEKAEVYVGIGVVHQHRGEYDNALDYYTKSLEIFRQVGNRMSEGTTLNNIGVVISDQGDKQKALEYFTQALEIRHELGDRRNEIYTLTNIGNSHYYLRNLDKALEYYSRALDLSRELEDLEKQSLTLNNMGFIYKELGDNEKALQHFEQALAIRKELGDLKGESSCLNNIGIIHYIRGDFEQAKEYWTRALGTKQQLEDRKGEADCWNNLAMIFEDSDEFETALDYHEKALAIRQEIGEQWGESSSFGSIAAIYQTLGMYDRALEYLNRCQEIQKNLENPKGEGNVLLSFGKLYLEKGQSIKAQNFLDSALVKLVEGKDQEGRSKCLLGFGQLDLEQKNYPSAILKLNQALKIADSLNLPKLEIEIVAPLALAYAQAGKIDSSAIILKKFDILQQNKKIKRLTRRILWNISQTYSTLGRGVQANNYLQKAYDRVMEHSEKMQNDVFRKAYLHNVILNREIISSWEKVNL